MSEPAWVSADQLTARARRTLALRTASRLLGEDPVAARTRLGLRRGTVTAITAVTAGQEPTYTVTVDDTPIPGVRALAHVGALVGDSVQLLKSGPDMVITGVLGAATRSWTPTLTATGTNPALGSPGSVQAGWYRMLGPTTMRIHFRILFSPTNAGAQGSGSYQITGLPRSCMYTQQVPMVIGRTTSDRRLASGLISLEDDGAATIWRIISPDSAGNTTFGLSNTTITWDFGSYLVGDGVLEVQP